MLVWVDRISTLKKGVVQGPVGRVEVVVVKNKKKRGEQVLKKYLDLVHGCDVTVLNVVFKVGDLLLQFFDGHFLVLDGTHDL